MDNHLEEIRTEITRQEPQVGEGELQIAIQQATDTGATGQSLVAAALAQLRQWRKQFVSPSGLATDHALQYAASERAAKEKLLESSAELNELQKLEKQRAEIDRKTRAQATRLEQLFAEFSALPGQAAKLHNKLSGIQLERDSLAEVEGQFRSAYTEMLEGRHNDRLGVDALGARLMTVEVRESVLSDIEREANAGLQRLDKRNAELSKILGRPKCKLN